MRGLTLVDPALLPSQPAEPPGHRSEHGSAGQSEESLGPLIAELVAAGTLPGGVTRSRIATGPLLSRVALSSAGDRHLMLDIALTGSPRVPWLAADSATADTADTEDTEDTEPAGRPAGARSDHQPSGTVTAVLARPVGPLPVRAWYHPTPWPPAMLAEVVTGAVPGPLPTPATFAALGAALARAHAHAPAEGHGSTVTGRCLPPPLQRVTDALERLTTDQHHLVNRILAGRDPVVPVHGQPALAHVLVPADAPASLRPGAVTPGAVLTGWSPRLGGSAALDLGHLLGDITEIAVLAGLSDPGRATWLRSRLADVRDGYCSVPGAAEHDPLFWDRVADGAVLRLLDHRCTLVGLLGPHAAPVAIGDRVAAHLASSAFRTKGFRP